MATMSEQPRNPNAESSHPQDGVDSPPADQGGKPRFSHADIFKFIGLIAFFLVMVIACILVWPLISELFEPGGLDRVIEQVQSAGPVGMLILLAFQFLQVVVAFIPGEVVQVAAGILFGPWIGALIIFVGCVISSAFVFVIVHALGAPFVHDMVPEKYMHKFREFEQTGRLNSIVFILFLIPGLPKDVFTYIVPLTDMKLGTFLLLSNIGRIPGILVSTYAAAGLVSGDILQSVVLFVIAAVVAILALVFYNRIEAYLVRKKQDRN